MKIYLDNFTFLLPVYNGGNDLKKILSSLENLNLQTNIIIYDDGSTDDSFQTGIEYANLSKHEVCIIDGKKNRGYFRTIKILLKICPTDFFIFLGHDDHISNNFLDEFDNITSESDNIACIFTDVATINAEGLVINIWPKIKDKDIYLNKMNSMEALKKFHKYELGNIFVGIWSKRFLNYKTLFQIMKCIQRNSYTLSLKKSGFLNDNMAVLRALSHSNNNSIIYYNKFGIYYKKVDPIRLSEGSLQYKKDKVLHSPLGYISTVAYFMIPQIKQRNVAILWVLRYLYVYLGVTIKILTRNHSSINVKMFLQGLKIIMSGYFANFKGK